MNDNDRTKSELIEELQKLRRYVEETKKTRENHERAEDVFRALEMDEYRAALDTANDAILLHDVKTANILGANQKAFEMFGYAYDETMRNAGTEDFPPYTREDALRWVRKAAAEGPQLFEWLAKGKLGTPLWLEVDLRPAPIRGENVVLAVIRNIGERKRVEQELHTTKDYLKTVFNKIHDALFVHDFTGKVVDVNEKVLDLYNCTREEAIGLHIHSDFSMSDAPLIDYHREVLWKKVMAGEDQMFEWKARRPRDGSTFDVEVCLSKLSLPHGDFILASTRDITDRKIVEKELRATKEYLKTVLNNIHDATYIHDLNGKIIDVNDKMLEMHKCSREETIGRSIQDFSADGNPLDQMPSIFSKVMSGEDQFFEWRCKRPKDGSVLDVEAFLTRLSLPDGDFILSNVRDITERKRLDRELVATKDYLKTVFNKIHDALFVHDFTGKVIDVNEKMLELYRCTREEAIGLSIIPDYSSPDNPLLDYTPVHWKKVMAGEDQLFEWIARRPGDGSTFYVEVCLSKLSLPTGDFVLASCRDITQRKGIEKMLMEEKEVFFSVMNDNPHGIALFDNGGRFVYFNPEFTAITGYTLEDVPTGREWAWKAYPDPEYRSTAVKFWKADNRAKGRGKDVELRIACKNGQNKDIEFRVTYLGDRSLVVLTDTTARNRAEEELRAEKQKFQDLSESSPMGMLMVGADDRIKYVNPKFKDLFGYDLIDIPDLKSWFARAYPDESSRRLALSKRLQDLNCAVFGEGHPYIREVTSGDGRQKQINFIPVRLKTGETLVTCEDITKSKEAEDKIRERNLELEVLNDIIASVSSSLDLPEILETLKNVFVEKLRIPVGGVFFCEELGNRLNMVMSWGIPMAKRGDFEAFASSRYGSGTILPENGITLVKNHAYFRPSGDSMVHMFLSNWHRCLCAPLCAKGEVQGMILLIDRAPSVFRDDQIDFFRTLVQQIAVALQNARLFEQVRKSNSEMKALSLRLVRVQEAELRHVARELHDEVGQLLTALRLALEMALQSPKGRKSSLLEAKSHAHTLTGLVRELSRNLRPSMLDDLGLLRTFPWLFERFSGQTNVQVVFEHSGVDNKRFPHEMETAIYRVAQEALTNVARHAKIDVVTVRLWSNDKTLGIQIEDQGVGFDWAAACRAGSSNGLSGMRERMMLLGGRFTVESNPGSGTRLTAELPTDINGVQS